MNQIENNHPFWIPIDGHDEHRHGMRFFTDHQHIFGVITEDEHLFKHHEYPIHLLNLSSSGCLIEIDKQLELNSVLQIRLYLNGKSHEVTAKIVRNVSGRYALNFLQYIEDIEKYAFEFEKTPHFGEGILSADRIANLPDL